MNYDLIKDKLSLKIPEGNIEKNVSMAKETTFRCGGDAALFVVAENIDELKFTLSVLKAFDAKWMMLGNGSNVLFRDQGFDGVIIKLGGEFLEASFEGNVLTAGAGILLAQLSKLAGTKGLSGLEFACGIPGSLGGAVFMNAGAYGGSIEDCIKSVTAMTKDGDIYLYSKDELELGYRHSRFMDSEEIVLFAEFELKEGNAEEILETMADLNRKRKEKQPVNYPSAGSFFKRPVGYYAAALIDEAGLKGASVGDAQVSELHAGFIINKGNATASDILALCEHVKKVVYEKSGVTLEPEVRII